MFNFENLRVYQDGLKFVEKIYSFTKKFPNEEMFGLTNQLRRASVSVVLNIAEGSSRTKKDFRHFLDLSRGSAYECVAIINISKNQNLIDENLFNELYSDCLKLAKMISALKNSIKP